MDTTTVAAAAAPVAADATLTLITTILPYTTPATILAATGMWFFKDELRVFLTTRGSERKQIMDDVKRLSVMLEAHIMEEKGFWGNLDRQEARVEKLEDETRSLGTLLAALSATVSAQHDMVMSKFGDLTDAVRDLRRP